MNTIIVINITINMIAIIITTMNTDTIIVNVTINTITIIVITINTIKIIVNTIISIHPIVSANGKIYIYSNIIIIGYNISLSQRGREIKSIFAS
jgi:hypothetical protein